MNKEERYHMNMVLVKVWTFLLLLVGITSFLLWRYF